MPPNRAPKDQSIETLRGIAIILVVGYHLKADQPLAEYRDLYEYLAYSFQNIRMPLFTVISGYLYGLRPTSPGEGIPFLRGKARRIALPLIVVATLQYVATALLPGVNNPESLSDIWRIYVFPYEHFWFLQSILLVFLTVTALEVLRAMQSLRGWFLCLMVSAAAFLFAPRVPAARDLFSFGGYVYLMPFFLIGLGSARFPAMLQSRQAATTAAVTLLVCLGIQQAAWFLDVPIDTGKRALLGLTTAAAACIALMGFRFTFAPLAFVGAHAYTIYLYQGFGSAFGRRIVGLLDEVHPHAYFALVLGMTIMFGILLEMVVRKTRFLRTPLLGLRPRRRGTRIPDMAT